MKSLSLPVFFGIFFSAIGTVALILTGQILTAAIWLSFGNGLILSNLRFKRTNETGNQVLRPIPRSRMLVGIFLLFAAVLMLLFQVYVDLFGGGASTPQ
ncbi:hypothetical protein [Pontibacter harenae]|uniref:hypothetical protein n=1 Tax=Pontibacter harenae TaxID=2894083 RepID=UPI001E47D1AF|nr:hypothetical protein [Pontibacter harenae]MCC9167104.1 hypothetical protein [Pontibacter harenae]